ncbi:MAG: MAE_28990/MAE_18760 family HEPN-like nuclease [Candidatus Thiodiazotropha sp.]
MSKPYSQSDFSRMITEDRTWRIKEISDLKAAILRADNILQKVLLRAVATLCYAHWEGYVKFAAQKYMMHIALRKYRYDELHRQFRKNLFLPRLAALSRAKTSLNDRCALIDEILDSSDNRYSRVNDDLIATKSNLNFEVFMDICLVCSVPIEDFNDESTFIDAILLKRRNDIAHGEDTFIDLADLTELTSRTISLMRNFGDALDNKASLKAYQVA